MSFIAAQVFNGLSHASTLFLMAAGLTLIFGVTRIVNFAHGSFYMLGALLAAHLTTRWFPAWGESAWLYALAMVLAALCAGAVGALADYFLLRHMAAAPSLYQLVATFGLTLFLHDAMLAVFGPEEVFAPRFPGLKGALELGGQFYPLWHVAMIVLGALVWLALHLLLARSRFGQRLRAATQDRAMLAALGVNPQPLMLGAVVLGCALAGLGGALRLPTEPANLQMDANIIVETFVVVVTGGLGSISGAGLAALLIGMIHAFGVAWFPQTTLVLVFLTMGVVLALRPHGLLGARAAVEAPEFAQKFLGASTNAILFAIQLIAIMAACALAWQGGTYVQSLAADALILAIFGTSLQAMMGLGGLVSFGHAAWFAVGAYGTALSASVWGCSLPLALAAGCAAALVGAAVFGALAVRSGGVYLAMLSLALAQMLWAGASQWVGLTGGDNGIIGLALVTPATQGRFFVLLVALALASVWGLRLLARSGFGAALQAARDAPDRAAASGLGVAALRYRVFVQSAVWAALAGGLWAAHKGAVFPQVVAVGTSVDALLVVLLGGVHWLWGALVGSALLTFLQAGLGQGLGALSDYWHGLLGLLVMAMMVAAPSGLGGVAGRWRGGR